MHDFKLSTPEAEGISSRVLLRMMRKLDELPLERVKRVLTLVGRSSMEIYIYQMLLLFVFGYVFVLVSGITPKVDGWLLGFIPINTGTTVFLVAETLAITALITFVHTRRTGGGK